LARVCSSESCRCCSCSRRWRSLSGSNGDRPKEKAFCINVLGDNFFLGETSELPDSCTGNRQQSGRYTGSGARTARTKTSQVCIDRRRTHSCKRAHTHTHTHTHKHTSRSALTVGHKKSYDHKKLVICINTYLNSYKCLYFINLFL
jgi:hypothetical protein